MVCLGYPQVIKFIVYRWSVWQFVMSILKRLIKVLASKSVLKKDTVFLQKQILVSVGDWSSLGTGPRLRNALLQEQGVAANLTTCCAERCVLRFWSSFFFLWQIHSGICTWKKICSAKKTSRQISPTPSQNKTEINKPKPLQKQNTPLHLLLSAGERMTEQMYNRSYLCWLIHYWGDAERL